MKLKLAWLALFIGLIVAADGSIGYFCRSAGLREQLLDLKHPAMLLAKLDELRGFSGRKVVLLGDSLVYGGILEEFGDRNWREHDLAHAIAAECQVRWPNEPVRVMNLGINGALPCDLERLMPLVSACGVDCIVFDIHLRPFSPDFADEKVRMARPWLDEFDLDGQGIAHWRPTIHDSSSAQSALSAWLADVSATFRYRHLLQESIVQSSWAKRCAEWRRPPMVKSENDREMQAMVKLGQLKHRLKQVTIEETNPQVAAFQRMLATLATTRQPYLIFYAKENPDLVGQVFDSAKHAGLYAGLTQRIAQADSRQATFVPPVDELRGEHFVDFTHLNADGYRILAKHLVAALPATTDMPEALARLVRSPAMD